MHNSTHSVGRFLHWLRYRADLAGRRIFRAPDHAARRLGWEIQPIRWGLGRRYRDPRIARRSRIEGESAPDSDERQRRFLMAAGQG